MLTSALNGPSPDGGDADFSHAPGNTDGPCRVRTGVPDAPPPQYRGRTPGLLVARQAGTGHSRH